MSEPWCYSETALDHFRHPRNVGTLDHPDGFACVGDPACGDFLEMAIRVVDDHIREVRFRCKGCPAAIACGSITTGLALGRHLDAAAEITEDTVEQALGGLPPYKRHCSNLGATALYEAIFDHIVRSIGPPGTSDGSQRSSG